MDKGNKRKNTPDQDITGGAENPETDEERTVEVVSLDLDEDGEQAAELDEETALELLQQAQKEAYSEKVAEHTTDKGVQEALEARQDLDAGKEQVTDRLEEHHAKSPTLSAGDLDAGWDKAGVGDETAGGTAATPDQDLVDELGEAYGISYEDDEPLDTEGKLAERDEERWELDPESTDE